MRPLRDLIATARFLLLPIVLFLIAVPGGAAVKRAAAKKVPGAQSSLSKVAPASALAALSAGESVDVIVEFGDASVRQMAAEVLAAKGLASESQDILEMKAARYAVLKQAAMASIAHADVETIREYSHLPMSFVRVRSRAALDRLLASLDVVAVYEDATLRKQLSESRVLVGQPAAFASGYRGAGTTVAVLDGGVEYGRAAFGSCTSPGVPTTCHVVAYQDFADPDNRLDDPDLHGTNVSGIVLGIAPDSQIAALDVFNNDSTNSSIVLAAINWILSNRATYNIVAMNLSLGGDTFDTPCASGPYTTPFANARAAGVVPVVASGNDGALNRLATPGCAPGAVSVGAVYDSNFGTYPGSDCASDPSTAADKVACFSNSASFLTLLAPGALITAAGVTQAGTSQASPHVAGMVAVLRSAFPGDSVDQTVARMTSTGTPVTDARNGITKPRINVQAATGSTSVPSTCIAQAVSCPGTLNGSLGSGDCTTGLRNEGQFTDAYTFSGTAGQTLTIDLTGSFDTYLILVSPSGTIAASSDDIADGNLNSRISNFVLNATGSWRVEVTSYWAPGQSNGDGGAGTYNLNLSGCAVVGPSTCTVGPNNLCLAGGRFRVQVNWQSPTGSGTGNAVTMSADTGHFWFFNAANVELVVKVLDARAVNGRFWVFYGALSDVQYTITVTDTATGAVKTYTNVQGNLASVADTAAF
ncbi:MAG: S8 family serine peptidase [Thermoanaerobaculia bacterium]